ncbi:Hypothetical predicted protein [Octopus vulgaris]|uniref:Uncharacterized protein n=1 Tax=Octopus vulgaris TaxID=6645 RepID=A0AA36BSV3_OCTVU|nr:Hypothetical predicted protein [Octopus vulgaris]
MIRFHNVAVLEVIAVFIHIAVSDDIAVFVDTITDHIAPVLVDIAVFFICTVLDVIAVIIHVAFVDDFSVFVDIITDYDRRESRPLWMSSLFFFMLLFETILLLFGIIETSVQFLDFSGGPLQSSLDLTFSILVVYVHSYLR